jgi:phage gpG-like protein
MSLQWRDEISPGLRSKIAAVGSTGRRQILHAMGTELVSITVRAFRDVSLRAASWPAKVNGAVATLYKSGALKHSIRITEATDSFVSAGSDRPYAAIHQVGGTTRPHKITAKRAGALFWTGAAHPVKSVNHPGSRIPPRPFLPVTPTGQLTPSAKQKIEFVGQAKLNSLLKKS